MREQYREGKEESQMRARRINADNRTIPHLKDGARFPITIAYLQDHGRLNFVASAIRSHPVFLEIARGLTPLESRRANDRVAMEMEIILDRDEAKRNSVLSAPGKPDIHVVTLGESFDPKGLRIYYTKGEMEGAPVIYQQAITRLKDATKVERVFFDAGYTGGKNREKRKVH